MAKDNHRDARESALASGWTVEGLVEESTAPVEPAVQQQDTPQAPERPDHELSNWGLIVAGVLGGMYLLYTVAWFSWANHYSQVFQARTGGAFSVDVFVQQILFWLAVLAPALWLIVAVLLNRGRRMRQATWLMVGLIVLLPLPVLFEAAAPTFLGGAS